MKIFKAEVIDRFLGFVSQHISLSEARMATLGGEGFEARIWKERKIPPEHGWLIERSRTKGRTLIRTQDYRHHNHLGTLCQVLEGIYGPEEAVIDGFHLDLCGTFDPAMGEFESALPLVLKSRGRCLAITVADARENRAIEEWDTYERLSGWTFGSDLHNELWQRLLVTQQSLPVRDDLPAFMESFDPEKRVKCELGLLLGLTRLLENQAAPYAPTAIERYVYISRLSRTLQHRPFRMRTYFFHFEKIAARKVVAIRSLAQVWMNAPLLYGNKDSFQVVGAPVVLRQTPRSNPKPSHKPLDEPSQLSIEEVRMALKTSGLAELVALVGNPTIIAEYEELVSDRNRLHEFFALIESIKKPAHIEEPERVPMILKSQVNGAVSTAGPVNSLTLDDLSVSQRIEFLLSWLELKFELKRRHSSEADQNKSYKEYIQKIFGQYTPEMGKSLRAATARTSGHFRSEFEKRIRAEFGDGAEPYLKRLAKLPELSSNRPSKAAASAEQDVR